MASCKALLLTLVLIGLQSLNSSAIAQAVCGSKEAEDLVENAALKETDNYNSAFLANAAQNLENLAFLMSGSKLFQILRDRHRRLPPDNNEFEIAAKKIISSGYEISLSEMYQSGEDDEVKKCHGTLKITVPDGRWRSNEIKYDIILTEDRKILLKWKDINLNVLALLAGLTSDELISEIESEPAEPAEPPAAPVQRIEPPKSRDEVADKTQLDNIIVNSYQTCWRGLILRFSDGYIPVVRIHFTSDGLIDRYPDLVPPPNNSPRLHSEGLAALQFVANCKVDIPPELRYISRRWNQRLVRIDPSTFAH